MVKKFEIWNSQINLEDWKDFLDEDKEANPDFYAGKDPFYAEYEAVSERIEDYLYDVRSNLDITLNHPILVIADLGRWNGRCKGYKLIPSGNIKDILQSSVSGQSECHWYCDGYNIRGEESHHDGVNNYLYREIRNEDNVDRFLDMIYSEKKISDHTLNYYTRSIAQDVARIYGFCS